MTEKKPTLAELKQSLRIIEEQTIILGAEECCVLYYRGPCEKLIASFGITRDGTAIIICNLDVVDKIILIGERKKELIKLALAHEIVHFINQRLLLKTLAGQTKQELINRMANIRSQYLDRSQDQFERVVQSGEMDQLTARFDELTALLSPLFLGVVENADKVKELVKEEEVPEMIDLFVEAEKMFLRDPSLKEKLKNLYQPFFAQCSFE